MRAPFAYYGGKMGMAKLIVSLMPEHRVYIEPFFGSGAVFFAKPPVMHEIVNDLDDAVVAFFRVLRDRPDDLERACALTPHARAEYESADLETKEIDDLERARRFWVRVNQSFGKAINTTGWTATTSRNGSVTSTTMSRLGRFAPCAERLAGTMVERCDAADLVTRLATPDAVVYVDPPYPHEARRSNRRCAAYADYRCDSTPELHERLADSLNATEATVILSGYPCDQYDRLYADWWTLDIAVTAHSSNARNSSRGGRTERIWSNRDLLDVSKQLELAIA